MEPNEVVSELCSARIIRRAVVDDTERIADLWQLGFTSGFASAQPPNVDHRSHFRAAITQQSEPFCYWVVEGAGATIVAWLGLSPCRSNPISRWLMAEMSCYVDPTHASGGVMTEAMHRVLAEIDATFSLQYVVGFVAATNTTSLRLCKRAGFEQVGMLPVSPNAPTAVPRCFLVRPCGPRPAATNHGATAA